MQFFDSRGVQIAFIDIAPEGGAGDPILLVHGFASNHAVNWVNTLWTTTLTRAGLRVLALDNRVHGQSQKLYRPEDYDSWIMAQDARNLLDHLGIARADVMGYSMGARIGAHLALRDPARVRSLLLGGLGYHLVEGVGLPVGIADAMEAPSVEVLTDPTQRMFRAFAEQTKSDLKALAACVRGSRQTLSAHDVERISVPTLVSVGTNDPIAGSAAQLAALFPDGDQGRQGDGGNLAFGQNLPRSSYAGGQRLEVALRLFGEGAEHALHGICQIVEGRHLHGIGDAERQADAGNEMDSEPAEDHGSHPSRLGNRHMGRNSGPHGIAHHVGFLDPEMIQKAAGILRHDIGIVVLRAIELLALAVTAIVEGDRPVPGFGQGFDPEGVDPVHRVVRCEAVNEKDRVAMTLVGSDIDIGDADAVGIEKPHGTGTL